MLLFWFCFGCTVIKIILSYRTDLAYFDGLGEIIVSVGLVKPKPDVFHEYIKYLLVLTTTVEIVVLGVKFSATKPDGQYCEYCSFMIHIYSIYIIIYTIYIEHAVYIVICL